MSLSNLCRAGVPLLGAAALTVGLLALTGGAAHAQNVYLVGAEFYAATSDGADAAPAAYLYDSNTENSGTSALELVLNGTTFGKGIAIQLSSGANNFTINTSPANASDPGGFAGIGLFFSTTPDSYNPASSARTPDLAFATAVASDASANFTPSSGTAVANYIFGSTSSANGFGSITEGSTPVSVTNFVVTHSVTGSFTINNGSGAGTAPEPGAATLLLAAGPILIGGMKARRRAVAKS